MTNYNSNLYINVTLTDPIELENAKISNVEFIPLKKIKLVDLSSAKIDFQKDQYGSFIRLLKATARNGENGLPLPTSFFKELDFEHMETMLPHMVDETDFQNVEIPDPN